jgi:hypothetical protein
MARVFLILVLIWTLVAWSRIFPSILRLALSSGILQARGRVYLRDMHPVRFWSAVYFHLFVFGVLALGLYALAFGGHN